MLAPLHAPPALIAFMSLKVFGFKVDGHESPMRRKLVFFGRKYVVRLTKLIFEHYRHFDPNIESAT